MFNNKIAAFVVVLASMLYACSSPQQLTNSSTPNTRVTPDTVFVTECPEILVTVYDTVYLNTDTTPTVVSNPTTPTAEGLRDHLGVVITPASDKLITGVPDDVSSAFKHVRYMGNGYALRAWSPPSEGVSPSECTSTDLSSIWNECDDIGMRTSMVRLNKLCTQFPEATITFVNEYFVGHGWPWKTLTLQELLGDENTRGPLRFQTEPDSSIESFMIDMLFNKFDISSAKQSNPRGVRQLRNITRFRDLTQQDRQDIYDIYLQEYTVTLNSLAALPNQIILEVMNENWGRSYIEVANIQYQAAMDAHKIHVSNGGNVILSSGPRQWTNRTINWAGGLLAESILEVPQFFLQYLNETGGVVSMNLYPSDPLGDTESGFVLYENWDQSPEWLEVEKLSEFLQNSYPNVTFNISETGFTSSSKETMPTNTQRENDREYVLKLIDRCLDNNVAIVYMYQIEEHSGLNEGKFVGTAVSEDIDWWIEISNFNETK